MDDKINLTGSVKIQVFGPDGKLREEGQNHNLVVSVGKSYLATWLAAASQAGKFMSYIALGTGTTGPASGNTVMEAECAGGSYARQVGALSANSNTWTNTATFGPGVGTGAITEFGLFSALSSGTMFAHLTDSVRTKNAGDTMVIAWTVTFN